MSLFPNQNLGINRQLNDGVRAFMLDDYAVSGRAVLCHNSCDGVSNPVPLATDLQRMVDFLKARPGQFVTVFLEDYAPSDVLKSSLASVNGLTDVLYRPDQEGVAVKGWPTMADLAARGKQLLIFSDRTRSADIGAGWATRDTFGVLYQREWTVENYWSMGGGIGSSDWSCYSRWGTGRPLTVDSAAFHPLFVMNTSGTTRSAPPSRRTTANSSTGRRTSARRPPARSRTTSPWTATRWGHRPR